MKVFALIYAEYTNSNEIFYYFMLDFWGFLILCYFMLFYFISFKILAEEDR